MDFDLHLFNAAHFSKLLGGKNIIFLGDSNIRALYKDMIQLSQQDVLISENALKRKMEDSFLGDELRFRGNVTNGRDYREERHYCPKKKGNYRSSFIFLTRVFDEYVQDRFEKCIKKETPDVVIMNSCLWDITRWGPKGVEKYKKNMVSLMELLDRTLSRHCLVLWLTTPPVSQDVRSGFLVADLEFLKYTLRFHVAEANCYCAKVVSNARHDVLDIHYILSKFLKWRTKDGIHWAPIAVRFVTNLILTHLCQAWGAELPGCSRPKLQGKRRLQQHPVSITTTNPENASSTITGAKRGAECATQASSLEQTETTSSTDETFNFRREPNFLFNQSNVYRSYEPNFFPHNASLLKTECGKSNFESFPSITGFQMETFGYPNDRQQFLNQAHFHPAYGPEYFSSSQPPFGRSELAFSSEEQARMNWKPKAITVHINPAYRTNQNSHFGSIQNYGPCGEIYYQPSNICNPNQAP